jgi:sensor c-di-GMP phosphodiesterase-like protein
MNTILIDFANEHTFIFLGIGLVCSIILSFIMIWLAPRFKEGALK